MRRFEFSDSTSNKFWEVEVKGKTLNVTFGKIETKGQSKPKDFATPEKAKAEMEKMIKEKTGKGYVEVGGKVVKEAKSPAKSAKGKKSSAGGMGEDLSKAEKKAKAEKVLLMFGDGQWELARGILEAAQKEHWLFEELLKGCSVKGGYPKPSRLIIKAAKEDYYITDTFEDPYDGEVVDKDVPYDPVIADLLMLEVLLHLPKGLAKLQKLRAKLGITIRAGVLSKYWIQVANDKFNWISKCDPGFFPVRWYEKREAKIEKVEKDGEARGKALNKAWRKEEDLGQGVKLEMVLVPAGRFMMGSPKKEKDRDDDETQHEVTLTKSYYMGKYVVTQEQWEQIMGNNPSYYKGTKLPVVCISWNDCQDFIRKLNAKTDGGYRLPTEAEWEYACRAGTTTAYFFGDKITPTDANYGDSRIGNPLVVGSYKPNGFGLYDMHGNVNEWCEDWYRVYPAGAVTDPKGPAKGKNRVLRGGDYGIYGNPYRSAKRRSELPTYQSCIVNGFRLARTI